MISKFVMPFIVAITFIACTQSDLKTTTSIDPDDLIEISDDNFRSELIKLLTDNAFVGKSLNKTFSGIQNLKILQIDGKKIANLEGIQALTALEILGCENNQIESIDLSKNVNLKELNVSNNKIAKLNIVKNTKIRTLIIEGNPIVSAEGIQQLKDLQVYNCRDTGKATVDISLFKRLKVFNCSSNNIREIDFSNNDSIVSLDVSDNRLQELDLKNMSDLSSLKCGQNQIKKLDIRKLKLAFKSLTIGINDPVGSNIIVTILISREYSISRQLVELFEQRKSMKVVTYSDSIRDCIGYNPSTGDCDKF